MDENSLKENDQLLSIDEALKDIKSLRENETERISLQFEYVKDEIQIRIESLKIDLNNLNDEYVGRLDSVKNGVINTLKDRAEENESIIENLTLDNGTLDEENNKTVKRILEEMKLWHFQMQFVPILKPIIDEDFVGMLSYNTNYKKIFESQKNELALGAPSYLLNKVNLNKIIKSQLTSAKHETIDLLAKITDLCVLPNGNLVCIYAEPSCIIVYDKNFMVYRTITKVDYEEDTLQCFIITDNLSRIYITYKSRILMADLDFKKIKEVGGQNIKRFVIYDLCYHKNYLYACDAYNHRIQQLSSDKLNFVACFPLDFQPFQIKIANNDTACIGSRGYGFGYGYGVGSSFYFYEIDTFVLKGKFDGHKGRLSEINSIFYSLESFDNTIDCFNEDGIFIESIVNEVFYGRGGYSGASGKIILFNENVYLVSDTEKQLIKFILENEGDSPVNPLGQVGLANVAQNQVNTPFRALFTCIFGCFNCLRDN